MAHGRVTQLTTLIWTGGIRESAISETPLAVKTTQTLDADLTVKSD